MNSLLYFTVALVLVFSFTNGMKDGCNVIATTVSSRSLPRWGALLILVFAELASPFLYGIPVALTVARGLINIDMLPHTYETMLLLLSGIVGATIWNYITWITKMPTSSSLALIGGMLGPFIYQYHSDIIPWKNVLLKVFGALFLSPVLGILLGFIFYKIMVILLRPAKIKATKKIKRLHIISLILLGSNHGTNDSQKAMGFIALALLVSGKMTTLSIPGWVMLASISSLVLGILLGGTKIIRTIGYSIIKVKPVHSLTSQITSILILLACNIVGSPVSTAQIISSSVIGVGSASSSSHVKWGIIKNIFLSWIFTIPMAGIISISAYMIFTFFLKGVR